jgi:cobalt-zinc-cadmium efflux system membrane fusion protein
MTMTTQSRNTSPLSFFTAVCLVTIITIGMIVLSGCAGESSKATDEAPAASNDTIRLSQAQQKNANLAFGNITQQTVTDNIVAYGSVHVPPQFAYSITAPYGGIVRSVRVLEGTHVHKGEVLATLEHQDFVTMQQDYLVTSSQLELAEQELKRQTLLSRDSVNPRKSLERAQSEVSTLRIQRKGLAEKLALLNIKASSLSESTLSRSVTLTSPIDGYVTSIAVNIGSYIQPNTPVLQVVDTDHMHIELAVFERDVPQIAVGDTVVVRITNSPDSVRMATVKLVGKEVRSDRTVPVHAHLIKHDATLTPGTSLSATLHTRPRTAWVVPEDAILRDGKLTFMFTGTHDRLIRRSVQTGISSNGFIELLNPNVELLKQQVLVQGASQVTGDR